MMMTSTVPPEFQPFWDHAASNRLAFPFCEECHRFHWYPLTRCPHCGSARLTWKPVSNEGVLYSWTVIHHAFNRADSARLPYVVALVDVIDAPGVRLVTNIDHDALPPLRAGTKGRLVVDHRNPEESRIAFEPD
jgi:uncharacterized protein